jgi:hypothetical protein
MEPGTSGLQVHRHQSPPSPCPIAAAAVAEISKLKWDRGLEGAVYLWTSSPETQSPPSPCPIAAAEGQGTWTEPGTSGRHLVSSKPLAKMAEI